MINNINYNNIRLKILYKTYLRPTLLYDIVDVRGLRYR